MDHTTGAGVLLAVVLFVVLLIFLASTDSQR